MYNTRYYYVLKDHYIKWILKIIHNTYIIIQFNFQLIYNYCLFNNLILDVFIVNYKNLCRLPDLNKYRLITIVYLCVI